MKVIVFAVNDRQRRFISEEALNKRRETMTLQMMSLTLSQTSFCSLDRAAYEVAMEDGIKAMHDFGYLELSSPRLIWLLLEPRG